MTANSGFDENFEQKVQKRRSQVQCKLGLLADQINVRFEHVSVLKRGHGKFLDVFPYNISMSGDFFEHQRVGILLRIVLVTELAIKRHGLTDLVVTDGEKKVISYRDSTRGSWSNIY